MFDTLAIAGASTAAGGGNPPKARSRRRSAQEWSRSCRCVRSSQVTSGSPHRFESSLSPPRRGRSSCPVDPHPGALLQGSPGCRVRWGRHGVPPRTCGRRGAAPPHRRVSPPQPSAASPGCDVESCPPTHRPPCYAHDVRRSWTRIRRTRNSWCSGVWTLHSTQTVGSVCRRSRRRRRSPV